MNNINERFTKIQVRITKILADQKAILVSEVKTQQKINYWRKAIKDITSQLDPVLHILVGTRNAEWQIENKNAYENKLEFINKLPKPDCTPKQILNMPCYLFFRKISHIEGLSRVEKHQLSALRKRLLIDMNLRIMAQVVQRTESDFLKVRAFGKSTLSILKHLLWRHELCLGMELKEGDVPAELFYPIEKFLQDVPKTLREIICHELDKRDVNIVTDLVDCDESRMLVQTALRPKDVNLLKTRLAKLGHTLYQQ